MLSTDTRQLKTEAICLKVFPHGESDFIVHFLSPELGKFGVIAKNVRKAKSQLKGACEVISVVQLELHRGKNLHILSQYESKQSFPAIRSDIILLAGALVAVELLAGVTNEGDTDSGYLYDTLLESLQRLEGLSQREEEKLSGLFEQLCLLSMQVLETSGYGLSVDTCVICHHTQEMTAPVYYFSPSLGGVLCAECGSTVPSSSRVKTRAETLKALAAPSAYSWSPEVGLNTQKLLHYYLSHKLERSLKAYAFLFDLLI
ncbi:MAG: DNA repair protein RecO [Cyanobacteria bacterium]|nr:DNA repair protein RecO [Cyanobacteriota bacterium]